MSISIVSVDTASSYATTGKANASGNQMYVFACNYGSILTGLRDAWGNTYTVIGTPFLDAHGSYLHWFRGTITQTAGGVNAISAEGTTISFCSLAAIEISGLAASPLDVQNATNGSPTAAFTTAQAEEIVLAAWNTTGGSGSPSVSGDFTMLGICPPLDSWVVRCVAGLNTTNILTNKTTGITSTNTIRGYSLLSLKGEAAAGGPTSETISATTPLLVGQSGAGTITPSPAGADTVTLSGPFVFGTNPVTLTSGAQTFSYNATASLIGTITGTSAAGATVADSNAITVNASQPSITNGGVISTSGTSVDFTIIPNLTTNATGGGAATITGNWTLSGSVTNVLVTGGTMRLSLSSPVLNGQTAGFDFADSVITNGITGSAAGSGTASGSTYVSNSTTDIMANGTAGTPATSTTSNMSTLVAAIIADGGSLTFAPVNATTGATGTVSAYAANSSLVAATNYTFNSSESTLTLVVTSGATGIVGTPQLFTLTLTGGTGLGTYTLTGFGVTVPGSIVSSASVNTFNGTPLGAGSGTVTASMTSAAGTASASATLVSAQALAWSDTFNYADGPVYGHGGWGSDSGGYAIAVVESGALAAQNDIGTGCTNPTVLPKLDYTKPVLITIDCEFLGEITDGCDVSLYVGDQNSNVFGITAGNMAGRDNPTDLQILGVTTDQSLLNATTLTISPTTFQIGVLLTPTESRYLVNNTFVLSSTQSALAASWPKIIELNILGDKQTHSFLVNSIQVYGTAYSVIARATKNKLDVDIILDTDSLPENCGSVYVSEDGAAAEKMTARAYTFTGSAGAPHTYTVTVYDSADDSGNVLAAWTGNYFPVNNNLVPILLVLDII